MVYIVSGVRRRDIATIGKVLKITVITLGKRINYRRDLLSCHSLKKLTRYRYSADDESISITFFIKFSRLSLSLSRCRSLQVRVFYMYKMAIKVIYIR